MNISGLFARTRVAASVFDFFLHNVMLNNVILLLLLSRESSIPTLKI